MTPEISKFRVFEEPNEAKYLTNYVSKNVLLTYYDQVKDVTDLTRLPMEYLDTYRPSLGGNNYAAFYDFFINTSTRKTVSTDQVSWKLKVDSLFKPISGQNLHTELTTPGIHRTQFQISLNYGGYTTPDVIYPELSPENQVMIIGEPIADGAFNWIYNVVLASGTEKNFFDPTYLAEGTKWCKLGASHGEASRLYGSFNKTGHTYLQFQSGLSSINKKLQVTDKANRLNLAIRKMNGDKIDEKYPATIISMLEAEFLKQIRDEKGKTMWMGESAGSSTNPNISNIIDQSSGYPIQKGPGVTEFLRDGNVYEFSTANFSIDMIEDLVDSLWVDSVPWQNRNIVFYTGTGGLRLWDSAIAAKYHGYGAQISHKEITKSGGGPIVPGSKIDTFSLNRPAFTQWDIFPGGSVKVAYLPILDSKELYGSRKHPVSGLPMASYQFIALDYGIEEGGPNVEMLQREDAESLFYLCGSVCPLGPIKSTNGSYKGFTATHEGGYYNLHYKDEFGVMVRNIKRTLWLKPAA